MPKHPPRRLLKSAALAAAAATLAKTIGFVREMVIAAFFGVGSVSDAFILVFTIPDILLSFVALSVASGFIPVYHKVKNKTDFTHDVMTVLLLLGLLISTAFTFFPGALVRLFAFKMEPETFVLAEYFARYMIWASVFILLTGIYNARLEISGDFFSAGIRSVWRNAVVIGGVIVGAVTQNDLVIALSVVAGEALCMVSLAAGCRKRGYVFRPRLDLHSPELRILFTLIAPLLLSNAFLEINRMIDRNFAASLGVGAISSLNYSSKLTGLFTALVGTSLMTVFFPHFSELAAAGNVERLKKDLLRGMMCVLAITVPVCIGMIILSRPGVRIVFQRGSFTAEDTLRTAACLRMYAPVIVINSINALLTRTFYAIQNTKTPAHISMAAVLLSVALNFLFVTRLGAEGLALATTISGAGSALLMIFFLRKNLGGLDLRKNLPELTKLIFASVVVGGLAWVSVNRLPLMTVSVWQSFGLCLLVIATAFIFYALLLLLMRNKIALEVYTVLLKFITRKRML